MTAERREKLAGKIAAERLKRLAVKVACVVLIALAGAIAIQIFALPLFIDFPHRTWRDAFVYLFTFASVWMALAAIGLTFVRFSENVSRVTEGWRNQKAADISVKRARTLVETSLVQIATYNTELFKTIVTLLETDMVDGMTFERVENIRIYLKKVREDLDDQLARHQGSDEPVLKIRINIFRFLRPNDISLLAKAFNAMKLTGDARIPAVPNVTEPDLTDAGAKRRLHRQRHARRKERFYTLYLLSPHCHEGPTMFWRGELVLINTERHTRTCEIRLRFSDDSNREGDLESAKGEIIDRYQRPSIAVAEYTVDQDDLQTKRIWSFIGLLYPSVQEIEDSGNDRETLTGWFMVKSDQLDAPVRCGQLRAVPKGPEPASENNPDENPHSKPDRCEETPPHFKKILRRDDLGKWGKCLVEHFDLYYEDIPR